MQTIEFKSELRDMDAARAQCRVIGAEHIGVSTQCDTYFRLTDGRLKRREVAGMPTLWVYYHRLDRSRPKMCNFTILSDAQARRRWGTHTLRKWLSLTVHREMWMSGAVRIHLDRVENLGTFLELESVVSLNNTVRACHAAIAALHEKFAPVLGEAISHSYSDLMAGQPLAA